MVKPLIVLARQLPGPFVQLLSQFGELAVAADGLRSEPGSSAARIYVSTAVDAVDAGLIERLPASVGLVANVGVGIDNIDLAAAEARGIWVSNTPIVAEDTADLTMALLLAACRRLSRSERLLRSGDWALAQGLTGQRVHGKTLGIIGFGAIGQAVARRATGFEMNIVYHGPNRKTAAEETTGADYRASLGALLAESDIVSLNCPLTASTHHLLNAETMAQMKPGAVLVNTGRGALVDEAALAAALASGQLGAAGLDVFEFEPNVTPALLELDNVTLLPHIGSATAECRMDMALRAAANIEAFLADGKPLDICKA